MWVRRLAAAAAFLTLVLIVAGGLVTNTDSGLACPDWPTCFGSPMPHMVGGVAVEHTHRLIATAVGLCTLGLCIGTLPRRLWLPLCGVFAPVLLGGAFAGARLQQRDGALPVLPTLLVVLGFAGCAWVLTRARGPGRLAVLALALVTAQGLLGGVTVIYGLPPTVLVLHLATSMLFLAVALVLAWRVSGARTDAARTPLLWVTAGLTYFQIVLAAAHGGPPACTRRSTCTCSTARSPSPCSRWSAGTRSAWRAAPPAWCGCLPGRDLCWSRRRSPSASSPSRPSRTSCR